MCVCIYTHRKRHVHNWGNVTEDIRTGGKGGAYFLIKTFFLNRPIAGKLKKNMEERLHVRFYKTSIFV